MIAVLKCSGIRPASGLSSSSLSAGSMLSRTFAERGTRVGASPFSGFIFSFYSLLTTRRAQKTTCRLSCASATQYNITMKSTWNVSTCAETLLLLIPEQLACSRRPPSTSSALGHQAPSNDPTKTKATFSSSVRTLARMQKYVFLPLIRLQTQLPKSNIRASFRLRNTHLAILLLLDLFP